MDKPFDIFVSFSNADRKQVDKIVNAITSFKVPVWYQTNNSKQVYLEEINKGIKSSKSFVVLLSSNSVNSIMVKNEINRALIQRKRDPEFKILPVIISPLSEDEEDMMFLLLGSFNWLNIADYKDLTEFLKKLFDQLDITFEEGGTSQSIYSAQSNLEVVRLDKQNDLYNSYGNKYLDEIFTELNEPAILDVGCSDGANTVKKFKERNYSYLLGFDIDNKKIELANKRFKDQKTSFICADILADEFEEKISAYLKEKNLEGFDLIHISCVILHLLYPKKALTRLRQFLKDDGLIFIIDEDDGMNVAYPDDEFFHDAYYIWDHSYESGDRHCARKIPSYLSDCGYSNIEVKSTTITSIDFNGKFKETIWDMYFNSNLWVVSDESYFNNIKAYEKFKQYKEKYPQYHEAYENGKYFLTLGIFFVVAKK